ncbi:SDR family oxidoreductase [Maribacter sp. PR1]|uniref:SDR family oxidoreductase n=1 Tax=Maribacter cobaltidurans TaxID=1178778 RepID=A0ABU7IVU9_9FLAO|nr:MULTISPECIES: SDR family oxidoreductase [Maribacter]MDC6389732.1 SDR family oxidoreductase [Maribacter sp. PR1]MEE1977122.1 SDR family oxidoreductase [Maribacter cobaltidurans]
MESIKNKVIWITGASSGIGEALSYQLNNLGCRLILSARREAELERVKSNCSFPEQVTVLPLDLANFKALEKMPEKALTFHNQIDILINNGGISQRSLIRETSFEVYQQMINVNYLGTIQLSRCLLPYFIENKSGHFVTVTSLMGKFSSPYRSGYCGAKHALHGFFDSLRMEHEKDRISVTLACPGFVQTNVSKNALVGDGTTSKQEDSATKNGITATRCAKEIIEAIMEKKFEVYIGGKEKYGVYLKRFFPKLLHKLVLKSKVR